jgi:hypothetical protein
VGIAGHGGTNRTTEELINGHAGFFAFNVPERHVNCGEGGILDRAIAPVGAGVDALPVVFNVAGVATDEQGGNGLDRGYDSFGMVVVARRTDTIETGLVGFDDDDDPCAGRTSTD